MISAGAAGEAVIDQLPGGSGTARTGLVPAAAEPSDPLSNVDLRAAVPEARTDSLRFAFEFPDLLAAFERDDAAAGRFRALSRWTGLLSILLVFLALLVASADHMLAFLDPNLHHGLRYFAAAAGPLGTAMGLWGLRRSAYRRRWIGARYRTEMLRLFHFRYLAARFPSVVAARGDPGLREAYRQERADALRKFRADFLSADEEALAPVLEAPERVALEWVVAAEPASPVPPEAAADLFAVWRKLRLEWQLGYCDSKLERGSIGFRTPRQQEGLLSAISWLCIGAILLLHVAHFAEPWLHLKPSQVAFAQLLVVWIALLALGIRALEGGLSPQREVERYEQYRIRIKSMLKAMDDAESPSGKLEIVRAFERMSEDEMHLFIRTHVRSRFLL
ncbi:MAG TPA: hypothetical protein VF650_03495 [Allosphingosinicella sp.]